MPQRRCVGCGRIAPKSELLRLALTERKPAGAGAALTKHAVLDGAAAMPGRGAYLCHTAARGKLSGKPSTDCVELATRRGGLARALRCAVRIDPELVESIGR